jgi:hypothetical protein
MISALTILTSITFVIFVSVGSAEANATKYLRPSHEAIASGVNTKIGEGTLSRFGFTVLNMSLWADGRQVDYDTPMALTTHYDVGFYGYQQAERITEEIDRLYPLSNAGKRRYKQKLTRVFPGVEEGDTVTALYLPEEGLRMYRNNRLVGMLDNPEMAKRFFEVWLNRRTSEPELRSQLLNLS